jgi:hypothetical protein
LLLLWFYYGLMSQCIIDVFMFASVEYYFIINVLMFISVTI